MLAGGYHAGGELRQRSANCQDGNGYEGVAPACHMGDVGGGINEELSPAHKGRDTGDRHQQGYPQFAVFCRLSRIGRLVVVLQ